VTRDCRIKIGDWGLGRAWSGLEKARYTDNVCTLWYRAPELLMGVANYSLAVDMWSIG
jgi:serine/threonine protein kinase